MSVKYKFDEIPLLENENSYKEWKKAILLWREISEIAKCKQASIVVLSLKGKGRKVGLKIDINDLHRDNGLEILLKNLDKVFATVPDQYYEAFKTFDSIRKKTDESLEEYIERYRAFYKRLEGFDIHLPSKILGLKLLTGANLTSSQAADIIGSVCDWEFGEIQEKLGHWFESKTDDDVIFVSELTPTSDQRKRAEELLLPPTFFLFENKPFPPGYDERKEEEKEERILQYIQDRDSGIYHSRSSVSSPSIQNNSSKQLIVDEESKSEYDCLSPKTSKTLDRKNLWRSINEIEDQVVFEEKCIIYIYVYFKNEKQWEELGDATVKILQHAKQRSVYRVYVIEEKTPKILADHVVSERMDPQQYKGSEKTCTYFALNYSEPTGPTPEIFAIRFKHKTFCAKFMDVISEAKETQLMEC